MFSHPPTKCRARSGYRAPLSHSPFITFNFLSLSVSAVVDEITLDVRIEESVPAPQGGNQMENI